MEYIGLAALKEAVGLSGAASDTEDDGVFRSVIFRASAVVDAYLVSIRPGYVGFASGSNSRAAIGSNTRTYSGDGDSLLFIDDAASVASVTVGGVAIGTDAWTTWPYNEVPKRAIEYIAPASNLYGVLTSRWADGTANVAVTGYFGLPTVPDEVSQVTLALAVLYWRRYQSGDPTSGQIQQTASAPTNDPEVQGILEILWPRWGLPWVGGA